MVALPTIRGGKKLMYTRFDLPLTTIDDCEKLGRTDPFYAGLYELVEAHKGMWNAAVEQALLDHFGVGPVL